MHLVMVGSTTPSHVYPSLALIAELVARGHRVSYLIGERLASLVAPTGAEVIAHPSDLPGGDEAWPEDIGEAMQIFLDDQIAVLPRVLEIGGAGAVLYEIGGFAGRVAGLDANGMTGISGDDFLGRPEACVVLIPRVIQPHQERMSDASVFAGPCIDATRTAGWTPAPGDDRPLVYAAFGAA
jgi:hypothetical protein